MTDDLVVPVPLSVKMLQHLRDLWEHRDDAVMRNASVSIIRDLFQGQDGHLLLIDKVLAHSVLPQPVGADIRGHLIRHHGYEVVYVDSTPLGTLDLEHVRLHSDKTAENLDHGHVAPALTDEDIVVAKAAVKLLRKLWDSRALHIAITQHTTNLVTRTGAVDLDSDEYELLDSWTPKTRMNPVKAAEVAVDVMRERHAQVAGEVPTPSSVSELYEHLERMHGHSIEGLNVTNAGHWIDRHTLKLHGSTAWPNHTHPA